MFNWWKDREFKKSIYWYGKLEKRILTLFLVSAIVPVIILGIILFYVTLNNVKEETTIRSHTELMENKLEVDNTVEKIEQYYFSAITSDEVNYLVENDVGYSGYNQVIEFMEKIVSKISFTSYVRGCTLINFETGWTYSANGIRRLESLNNAEECIEIFENSDDYCFWINNAYKDTNSRGGVDLEYLSLAFKLPLGYNEETSMLIINIYESNFESLIKNSQDISTIIFDENGDKIYGTNKELDNFIIENIYNEIKAGENGNITSNIYDIGYTFNDEKYLVSYITSNDTNWTYVTYINESVVTEDAYYVLYIAVLLAVVTILLITLVAAMCTHWIYQQIKNIYVNFRSYMNYENTVKVDELEIIDKGLNSLYSSNLELGTIIDSQNSQLVELFVLRLIRGQLTDEMIYSNLDKLDIKPWKYISVVLINCSQNKEGNELSYLEKDILHIQVAKSMPDKIKGLTMFAPVNNTHDIVLVVCDDDIVELEEKINEVCNNTNKFILENFGLNSNIGVSKTFTELIKFPKAYSEAREALKRGKVYEKNKQSDSFYYYSNESSEEDEKNSYNIIFQNEVKAAVDSCDEDTAFKVTEEFLKEIEKNELKWNEQYYFLYRFLLSILVIGADAGVSLNSIFEFREKTLFQQFNQLYTLKEIEDFYKYSIIRPVIAGINDSRKNDQSELLLEIEKLVIEKEGNITLTECADALNCHANTIWRIMKNHRNQTFSDYTAVIRLEKAEDLLINTDLSINEIAEILNYTNAQNFIRYFKKHRETTPGKFRQDNKK